MINKKIKKVNEPIHKLRFDAIKRDVNFKFDFRKKLKKHEKRKIKKYFDAWNALTSRPFQRYRPKTKEHFKKAAAYSGQNAKLQGFKTVFIPTDGKKIRVRFDKKGSISVNSKFIHSNFAEFNQRNLALNSDAEVARATKGIKATRWKIKTGEFEKRYSSAGDIPALQRQVKELMGRYDDKELGNYWGNWLFGATAYTFKKQQSPGDYFRAKEKAKQKLKKDREKQRSKRRRALYKTKHHL